MKNYQLRSSYDCMIKHLEGESFLDANSAISFNRPEKLLVYPLNQKDCACFPFFIDLSSSEQNEKFRHFNFKDCEVFFLDNLPCIKSKTVENVNIKGKNINVIIGEDCLSFESEDFKKSVALNQSFETYSIFTDDNLIIVHLIGFVEDMWIFNSENLSFEHLFGKKIEKIEKQIFVSKDVSDFANHEMYENYEIKENVLVKLSSKIKYASSEPEMTNNDSIVPFAFLEAIKFEDFELAKKYLSPALNQQTSNEHLKKFFGNFSKILILDKNNLACLDNLETKIFEFSVTNGKISDISPLR